MLRSILIILLALIGGYAGAQGGDAVYRSLRVEIPIERRYLEPQGLQDADWDLLHNNMSITSTSYVNVMSAEVTVGEPGDVVLVHVKGLFGETGTSSLPCMVRITRGTMEIEMVQFNSGEILFDTTISDAPPAGTHTYNLQFRTQAGGGCTAYRRSPSGSLGAVPLMSMLVQSFYGGSIP